MYTNVSIYIHIYVYTYKAGVIGALLEPERPDDVRLDARAPQKVLFLSLNLSPSLPLSMNPAP